MGSHSLVAAVLFTFSSGRSGNGVKGIICLFVEQRWIFIIVWTFWSVTAVAPAILSCSFVAQIYCVTELRHAAAHVATVASPESLEAMFVMRFVAVARDLLQLQHVQLDTKFWQPPPHNTTVLRPFFLEPPGWAGARRELLDFMVPNWSNLLPRLSQSNFNTSASARLVPHLASCLDFWGSRP